MAVKGWGVRLYGGTNCTKLAGTVLYLFIFNSVNMQAYVSPTGHCYLCAQSENRVSCNGQQLECAVNY